MTVILAIDSWAEYAVLQSEAHWKWTLEYGNKLETRPQYTPTDCFETFPFPEVLTGLDDIGKRYYEHRQKTVQYLEEGLTDAYNRFHDPDETSTDIVELRHLHVVMDQAVNAAYGWQDINLGHGFHETKQGIRFTISEAARREALDRLLALNHQRHAEEVAATATQSTATPARRGRKRKDTVGQWALDF